MDIKGFHGPVKASPCPGCKGLVMGATSADAHKRAPVPGDLTVCIECGQIAQFGTELELEPVTDADLLSYPRAVSQQLRAMRRAVRARVERVN
jgi:hypothetical protein